MQAGLVTVPDGGQYLGSRRHLGEFPPVCTGYTDDTRTVTTHSGTAIYL